MKTKNFEQMRVEERENAGAAMKDGRTGRRTWHGYEKRKIQFVSNTIKWSTPISGAT